VARYDSLRSSGQSGVGHSNPGHKDRGAMVGRGFGFVKGGSGAGKECSAIVAAQHTGECAQTVGIEFVENCAARSDPNQALLDDICDPDSSLGIEADAVGHNVSLFDNAANVRRCRGIAESRPNAAIDQ